MPASAAKNLGSTAHTRGIRVDVTPSFLPEQSDASLRRYVFAYRIRIHNGSAGAVRLLRRHWIIVDARGEREEVEGAGVVGQQPEIGPGEVFEYASFCPLATPWGTMEGSYQMQDAAGEEFSAAIARFYLAAPADGPAGGNA